MVKTAITDREVEEIWDQFEDATMVENKSGMLVLSSDFYKWKEGTTQKEIWAWFNKNHSKGIQWLMYERE